VGRNSSTGVVKLVKKDHTVLMTSTQTPTPAPEICTWTVEMSQAEQNERSDHGWYPDSPSDLLVECGAPWHQDDDNLGWHCDAGHAHRSDAEYFEEEEALGMVRAGNPLPANALLMDGRSI